MQILFGENELEFNVINHPLLVEKKISLSVARLDKIHPVVSGNKLFKLHYFLQEALKDKTKPVLTFGGAYSNHLAATAFACKECGLKSIGIVRGEAAPVLSHTLKQCEADGMELHFVSREMYKEKNIDISSIVQEECIVVPEGGYHPLGADGASLIMEKIRKENPTHVCTAVGTATTLAGLLNASTSDETIIGIPVLKGLNDIHERIGYLCNARNFPNLEIFNNYHFGGYAKKTSGLINFMNEFYLSYHVPTDFVYTAKMLFGVMEEIKQDFFKAGSRIICLHTGGLQGNDSLPHGTLVF